MGDNSIRLSEIRARLNAATEGPWNYFTPNPRTNPSFNVVFSEGLSDLARSSDIAEGLSQRNAEFIAAAPSDIAYLLDEVEQLNRRLYPGQGDWPANEVERRGVVIEDLKAMLEAVIVERDTLRAEVSRLSTVIERIAEEVELPFPDNYWTAPGNRLEHDWALVAADVRALVRAALSVPVSPKEKKDV